jgi:hypothetical protein
MTNTFQVKTEANLLLHGVEIRIVGKSAFVISCTGVSSIGDKKHKASSEVEVNLPASLDINKDLALHTEMYIKAITKTLEQKE